MAPLVLGLGCGAPAPLDHSGPTAGWSHTTGGEGGGQYSPVDQITRENVGDLEVAWTHHSGDVSRREDHRWGSSYQVTPILVDDALVFCTPFNRVIAIDAETGEERWAHDPGLDWKSYWHLVCRGVAYWEDARARSGTCSRRIFTGTVDARLIALDAGTGRPCPDFGEGGEVDLTRGIGDIFTGEYSVTSPPAVVGDRVIVGALVGDNIRTDAPGGVVRAYDARTGELAWYWDPVSPGSSSAKSAGAAGSGARYRRGTANVWSILSVDSERGLVFVPTGNAAPDVFGGARDGLDHYSSSVLALAAETGEVVWHFRTVHHDLWDYDVPAQPALFDFETADGPVPALVQATKMGHLFFLHRETGEPLFPVEERPVPQGGVSGEWLSPTQPFPTRPPPIHPARLDPENAFGITPWDRGKCRERIAALRSEGIFTPPTLQGTVVYPGPGGGFNWGGVAIDPERRILVANQTRVAAVDRLIPREDTDLAAGIAGKSTEEIAASRYSPMDGTPYVLERDTILSPLGIPCSPPPWGTLVGVDIDEGEILYDLPLGTTRDLAPFPLWLSVGVPNIGGPIATGSGLVFLAATTDDFLRAFDIRTGEELWKGRLPGGGQATPMTYRLRPDSRQYVVIAAGGHDLLDTTRSDALVAFALPDGR